MKRVLVTGASGFVGANLARRLAGEGYPVHLLVPPGSSAWRLVGLGADARLHEADLADAAAVTQLVRAVRPEWVFHLAAHGAYSWQTDARRMVQTNVLGTINLLEACAQTGCEAVVNAGSSSEYGEKDHAPSEDEILDPNSAYAATKAAATHFCRLAARQYGLRAVTLRLYSVYGPWEEPGRLWPTLVEHALRGTLPPLADPEVARDFVEVSDVVEAFLLAAGRADQPPAAVYNVGTGVQTTLRDLVELVRCELGVAAPPQWGTMPRRSWDTTVWVADGRRIQDALGWRPRQTLAAGLARFVAWFREHPELHALYRPRQAA
jgi:dolichol-phosphate mannosyltransferase